MKSLRNITMMATVQTIPMECDGVKSSYFVYMSLHVYVWGGAVFTDLVIQESPGRRKAVIS